MELFAFMSPDEAIMRVMAGPLILSIIAILIAVPMAIRRRNTAINDPEKFARILAYEKEERERAEKRVAEAAATGVKVVKTIAKWLPKK